MARVSGLKVFRSGLAPLALLLGAAAMSAEPGSEASDRVRADVEFLASDLLEGRETGSEGYEIAAAYVASRFRSIGLEPGGEDGGWYQQVPLREASRVGDAKATLTIGKKVIALDNSDFAARPSIGEQARSIDAALVFAGHGVSDAQLGIDNYAGLDVRGKVVVTLEGAPQGLPSEVAAHLGSYKQSIAASKGAVGLIEIAETGPRPGFNRLGYYSRPVLDWVGPAGTSANQNSKLQLVAAISRKMAAQLMSAAGRSLESVIASGARPGTLTGFPLPARLAFADRMEWKDFDSPNVIGVLPGADPELRKDYVVLMGHLDHLGVKEGAKAGEDSIYNGAIDNAAGIATLLEAARQFADSGKPPRRSVLFIAVTGEEKGLRGADYLAANPPVPIDRIVAVVNLDMPMLLYDFTDVIAFGGEHSTIAPAIAEAAKAMGVKVSPDPMPDEAIFVRSDHYPFVKRGVPAILLMTGYANGGESKWKEFFASTYHNTSDDLSQPIRWDQGARYAELNYRIARELADSDQRASWYEGDYFGETLAPGQPKGPRPTAP